MEPEETFTAAELAQLCGHVRKVPLPFDDALTPDHLAADQLHGWTLHEKQTGEVARLSKDDYLAAIEAAKVGEAYEPANFRKPKEVK